MRYVFAVDALIAISFGAASGLMPLKIYGSIVNVGAPATVAALTSLSLFYVLLGAVCVVAFFAPRSQQLALGGVMLARHLLSCLKGVAEVGAPWQVGDPKPDLIIHAGFITAYLVALVLALRHPRTTSPSVAVLR